MKRKAKKVVKSKKRLKPKKAAVKVAPALGKPKLDSINKGDTEIAREEGVYLHELMKLANLNGCFEPLVVLCVEGVETYETRIIKAVLDQNTDNLRYGTIWLHVAPKVEPFLPTAFEQALAGEKPHATKFIKTVTVTDPDSGGEVEVEIRKDMVTGAMVGLDGSYLEQNVGDIFDPYNAGNKLDVPEDEDAETFVTTAGVPKGGPTKKFTVCYYDAEGYASRWAVVDAVDAAAAAKAVEKDFEDADECKVTGVFEGELKNLADSILEGEIVAK